MNKSSLYYPELNGLRFIAFLVVLIHHSPAVKTVPAWMILKDYGWIGVDLFLCLSALLFTKLLFVEHQIKGNINIGYFYLRRVLRIWPLYFFFSGLMIGYSIFMHGWRSDILIRSLGMLTFTDNLFSMSQGYNFAVLYSIHLWTVSYEEQFYLAIPWVLRIFYRMKKISIVYILGAVTLLGMFIRALLIYYRVGHPDIWVFPLTHFESIIGGLILGFGLFDEQMKKIPSFALLLAGLFMLSVVSILPNVHIIHWNLMLTYPLVGSGVSLITFSALQGGLGPLTSCLRNKVLGYLGKISYGLYVYHFMSLATVINVANSFVSPLRMLIYPVVIVLTTLIVTVLISSLSYEFLEKPFLRVKERFTLIQSRPI